MKDTLREVDVLAGPALKDSELRYRRLFEAAQDGILILDARTGMIEDVNPFLMKMLDYSREEFVEKKLWEVGAFKDIEASQEAFEALQENEYIRYEDLPLKTKYGRLIQVEFVSNVYFVDGEKVIQCNIRDITERKRAEEALQASQLIIEEIINAIPMRVFWKDKNLVYLGCNAVFARDAGLADPKDVIGKDDYQMGWRDQAEMYRSDDLQVIESGISKLLIEEPSTTPEGNIITLLTSKVPLRNSKGEVIGALGTYIDITERKQAEDALRESEERYRLLVETLPDGVVVHSQGRAVFVNPASSTIIGAANPSDLLGKPVIEFVHPDYREMALKRIQQSLNDGGHVPLAEEKFVRLDGTPIDVEVSAIPFSYAGEPATLTVFNDITKRKRAEAAIKESETRFKTLYEKANDTIFIMNADVFLDCNLKSEIMFGCRKEDIVGRSPIAFSPSLQPDGRLSSEKSAEKINAALAGLPQFFEWKHIKGDGTPFDAEISLNRFDIGEASYLQAIVRDITERKRAEERIKQQLEHLTALSAIDRVIAANFDLKLSLAEILTHVTMELGVDAADILILNFNSQILEFGAERGFRTKAPRKAQVRLGESYAGRVALKRQLVQIQNLIDEPNNLLLTTHLTGEDFVCYYGVPLIAKGQVKGVLEVFHRTALEPDAEWLDFLYALAGQAAIAIENATLFDSLQRSNMELTLAYDATIEGWSHALDLRDKETEGHTQRVTEMAVSLARTFGLDEAELVQVRWGALLHDIGKMGVPDGILLKPGPLTDEEWVAMKKHPTFAYEMLAPISYLHAALDIPYCHHEKWDGTGYPRGLKSAQIPLVARIFAVVDVWDALNSDRPYRAAWTKEKVREHILASSGTHFDPQVVDTFMQIHNTI